MHVQWNACYDLPSVPVLLQLLFYNINKGSVICDLWFWLTSIISSKSQFKSIEISVCISVPLWQIRIFGWFFTPNPDIRIFYPDIFVQVRIGPYILFSSCKWHRRCRPTDQNKNCSNVNTITWWCNVFKTSDSLKVNDEDSLKSSESEESLRRSDSED